MTAICPTYAQHWLENVATVMVSAIKIAHYLYTIGFQELLDRQYNSMVSDMIPFAPISV